MERLSRGGHGIDGVDGAAWTRGSGDDDLGAQQGLRPEGGSAESGWPHGWICLDAGAAVCDGVCDVGAAISMGFSEGLSDDGSLTGRGHPFLRGAITGIATFIGGILHTLPFLI